MNLHLDENIAVDTACLISRTDKTDFAVVKKEFERIKDTEKGAQ